ncbi:MULTISPECIES: HupE/UreJ family protein [Trichocoleus]|uniref:HupE/UreJ family protein n=1 Tax=Trichocoleus desertorum GB2-A4 TaxID=2933944 RepID=A0ABV0JH57_9CYAN|nr:HupE/UreJ family protein [Trichocoleus sp. FACHB-46]MBD1864489.1 HupE/UreJ family protein [Trichocoleus sp. FACHB-46]
MPQQLLRSISLRTFNLTRVLQLTTVLLMLFISTSALAHHPMGGKTPSNFVEGFLSGVAHPVIGFDHFAFIVAVGLLAATKRQGILIAIAFVLSAMVGTGLHLMGVSLLGAELLISGSVLLFGILLVLKDSPNTLLIMALAALAGMCHGYAYGEAIFGASMVPLLAYLLGFTVIQMGITTSVMMLSQSLSQRKDASQMSFKIRFAGFVLCGIGAAFFSSQLIDTILPTLNN